MTEKQFQALLAYIDARIDEKITGAFGRDSISEYLTASDCKKDLRRALYLDMDYEIDDED